MVDDPTEVGSEGAHPSRAQLASFAWGGTAVGVDLSDHLAACARCREIVAQMRPVGTYSTDLAQGTPAHTLDRVSGLALGTMIGRYRILDQLGQGGMGVVYRAHDCELDRPVALKLVHARAGTSIEELTERLRRESRLQARASHPAVITVHDIGRDGDRVYVAMELAQGGTLRSWISDAPRSWRDILDVFVRAGEGLAAAHDAGLVHRDFKPDNVLVEERGGRVARVLVTDFGVARTVEAVEQASSVPPADLDLTTTGALIGTPAYMAPEQLHAGTLDARTDVFAFGVSLWEALYGERPYRGQTIGELVAAMEEPLRAPGKRGAAPRWIERVLRRAIAITPAHRFASMTELLRALDWRRRRRTLQLVVAAVTAAGVLAAVAVVALGTGSRTRAAASVCDRDPAVALQLADVRRRLQDAPLAPALEPFRRRWVTELERFEREVPAARAAECARYPAPANRDDRAECFDRAAAHVAASIDKLLRGDHARFERLVQASPVNIPYECASDAAAANAALYPTEPQRAAVVEARLLIGDAVRMAPGDPKQARELIDDAAAKTAAIGFRPLVHEVALARKSLEWVDLGAGDEIREIAVAAERDGHVAVAERAWLRLAVKQAETDGKRALDLLAQADVALDRAGNPPRDRASWLVTKAYVLAQSQPDETSRLVDQAQQLLARTPFDPVIVAWMGSVEIRAAHFDRAMTLHARAYDFIVALGSDDAEARFVRSSYAASLNSTGKPDAGREVLQPIVDRVTAAPGMLGLATTLADSYNQLGRYEDTLRLVDKYRPALDALLGKAYVAPRMKMHEATAAYCLKRYAQAHQACAVALEHHIQLFGPDAYDTGDVRVLCGQIQLELGQIADGRRAIEQGFQALVKTGGERDPLAIQARVGLADALLRDGHPAQALAQIEPGLEAYRKLEPDPAGVAGAELILAKALVGVGRDRARARQLVEHAITAWSADPAAFEHELADARAVLQRVRR
ncbi:MAG TPA: protein kinase [Kofleriaceae bacterium]|nr:protein kinase [Kofleriaceae bacterium]